MISRGPVFKKSSQNLPPDPYISLYTWKTTACKILKHFDNFWTHLFVLKVSKNCHFSPKCPFSSIYFNHFLSKMRKNSLFIMIFRMLVIIIIFRVFEGFGKNMNIHAILEIIFKQLTIFANFKYTKVGSKIVKMF